MIKCNECKSDITLSSELGGHICFECFSKLPTEKDQKMEDKKDQPDQPNHLDLGNPEAIMEYIGKSDKDAPEKHPGPKAAPMSVNGRVIVETYKEDRALKATVQNGFAMVQQKVQVVGLKVLAETRIGDVYVRRGDTVYIKESSLQSAPWAKASFTADVIEGQFMIVTSEHIEFVDRK